MYIVLGSSVDMDGIFSIYCQPITNWKQTTFSKNSQLYLFSLKQITYVPS